MKIALVSLFLASCLNGIVVPKELNGAPLASVFSSVFENSRHTIEHHHTEFGMKIQQCMKTKFIITISRVSELFEEMTFVHAEKEVGKRTRKIQATIEVAPDGKGLTCNGHRIGSTITEFVVSDSLTLELPKNRVSELASKFSKGIFKFGISAEIKNITLFGQEVRRISITESIDEDNGVDGLRHIEARQDIVDLFPNGKFLTDSERKSLLEAHLKGEINSVVPTKDDQKKLNEVEQLLDNSIAMAKQMADEFAHNSEIETEKMIHAKHEKQVDQEIEKAQKESIERAKKTSKEFYEKSKMETKNLKIDNDSDAMAARLQTSADWSSSFAKAKDWFSQLPPFARGSILGAFLGIYVLIFVAIGRFLVLKMYPNLLVGLKVYRPVSVDDKETKNNANCSIEIQKSSQEKK
jgi:hypothetical protein